MSTETDDTTQFARYLAGGMDHAEAQSLEARILVDDELFEHCMAIETEMVDAWIRGELGQDEVPGLMQLLSTSSRLQRTFQTTLGLDASHTAVAGGARSTSAGSNSGMRQIGRPRSPLVVGLVGGLVGAVLAATIFWAYSSQQLASLSADLKKADSARTQLTTAVEQQRQANIILQRELAQLEAAQRSHSEPTP